ncbi:hypothetical protein CDL12_17452 [Handroanthus impetiginosus]|uniref:MADS-box domain-containing protein n=1 Tax=Handroanthus impetiginosus TaxID=429701 RepID=A0A2G9GXF8_9LAMI|nr:hypothetical protein CDL12_17452 [Handroanthus impetiginosus]
MPRKRVSHKKISNEREKNVTFVKTVESLIKKANDLSILCGVDIGIVVHKPTEYNAVLWPNPEIFHERMQKFLRISERERAKKMMTHDKFLKKKLNDEKEDMQKYQNKNYMNESCLLMNELFANDEMLKKIQKKEEEIDNYHEM